MLNAAKRMIASILRAVPPLVGAASVACLPQRLAALRLLLLLGHRRVRQHLPGGAQPAPLKPLLPLLDALCGQLPLFAVLPRLLSALCPPLWRTLVFYRHMVPVLAAYLKTVKHDVPRSIAAGASEEDLEDLWQGTHEWGAERMHAMLARAARAHRAHKICCLLAGRFREFPAFSLIAP